MLKSTVDGSYHVGKHFRQVVLGLLIDGDRNGSPGIDDVVHVTSDRHREVRR
jgi:hypothetical protein